MTSKERAALRAQANTIDTTLMVGKGGVSETLVAEAEKLLDIHELVKGRVLETAMMTPREVCDALCEATGADKTNIKGSAGFLRRDLFALNNLKISVIWPLVKIYKNLFCKNSQFRYLKFWMPIPQKFIGKRPTILYNKYRCCQNGKRFAFRRNGNILRTSSIIGGDTNRKFNERYINDRNESIKKQPPLPRNRSLL